jgi:superfamily II DNA or RNA helicase
MAERLGSALTIGETDDRDAELQKIYSGETATMSGTLSIWKEGISCNPLSCVVLATPINNEPMLEQLIGRVQRLYPDKLNPVVVDLVLRGHTTERQFVNRTGFYMKEGFTIEYL